MGDKRKPIIVGNWKMNGKVKEAVELALEINRKLNGVTHVDMAVCPPFTALSWVGDTLKGSTVKLGAQDLHWEAKGAYTGEISPPMLLDVGCTYVILGHSERRHIMGETNDMINKKVKAALAHHLTPIICVGELLEERSMGVTKEVVKRHVDKALEGLTPEQMSQLIFAYEPVWAIGTGKNASPKQAQDVHFFIRNLLAKAGGDEVASAIRIQYGGSVKPENIKELMAQPDIDGALVGGASLDADAFEKIVRFKE